jgi:hypothetical protein
MSMDQEWRRLQALYAAMSDDELLELARDKAGLTEVAQQVVEAEMGARQLVKPEDTEPQAEVEMPESVAAADDPSLVGLATFDIPSRTENAMWLLEEAGIPATMESAMQRMTAGGPLVKTNWLTVFVERSRKEDAVVLLRKHMGLFPVLRPEEVEDRGDADDEGDEGSLFTVGQFDVDADAEVAQKALKDADIWFKAGKETFEAEDDQPEVEVTRIEVRFEDMERASAVVEKAFGEEDPN